MAKRGQLRPWRVRFQWDTGIKGVTVCDDEWSANHKADEIRRSAEAQDRTVDIEVFRVSS